MMVLGTHTFNLMRHFAGDVTWMFSRVTFEGRDITARDIGEGQEPIGPIAGDRVHSFFSFASGATGTFESRRRANREGRPYGMELVGTEGRLAFDASANTISLLEDDASTPWQSAQFRTQLDLDPLPLFGGNSRAIEDLIDSTENDHPPRSSAFDGRAALEMILGAYASQLAGARVALPLADRVHPLERLRDAACT